MKATTHLQLVTRLKTSTAVPPLEPPIMPSWHTQVKLYVLPSINVNMPSYHFYQKTVITEIISIHRYMHELFNNVQNYKRT